MDEISRGLDEMALRAPDSNTLPHREGHVAVEACGCAEVSRNDSVGDLSTPLHRCKGRHHLPIVGEEMQGDQLPKVTAGKPDSVMEATQKDSADPCGSHYLDPGECPEWQAQSCDAVLQHDVLVAKEIFCPNPNGAEEKADDSTAIQANAAAPEREMQKDLQEADKKRESSTIVVGTDGCVN